MAKFVIAHPYASNRAGRKFGPWERGEQVDLSVADADWVQRDFPGVLVKTEKGQAEDKPVEKPARPSGRAEKSAED